MEPSRRKVINNKYSRQVNRRQSGSSESFVCVPKWKVVAAKKRKKTVRAVNRSWIGPGSVVHSTGAL